MRRSVRVVSETLPADLGVELQVEGGGLELGSARPAVFVCSLIVILFHTSYIQLHPITNCPIGLQQMIHPFFSKSQ